MLCGIEQADQCQTSHHTGDHDPMLNMLVKPCANPCEVAKPPSSRAVVNTEELTQRGLSKAEA